MGVNRKTKQQNLTASTRRLNQQIIPQGKICKNAMQEKTRIQIISISSSFFKAPNLFCTNVLYDRLNGKCQTMLNLKRSQNRKFLTMSYIYKRYQNNFYLKHLHTEDISQHNANSEQKYDDMINQLGVIFITLANKLLIQGPYVGYPKIVALDLIIDTDHFLRQTTQLYFYKNIPKQAYDGTK